MTSPNEHTSGTGIGTNSTGHGEGADREFLYAVGVALLEGWWVILTLSVIGAALAVIPTVIDPAVYTSRAVAMAPQSGANVDSRIAGIAAQLGLNPSVAGAPPTTAPGSLVELAKSRVILERMFRDSVTIKGRGVTSLAVLMLGEEPDTGVRLDEPVNVQRVVSELRGSVVSRVGALPGSVEVLATTQWPEVSKHLASRVVEELDRFNRSMVQGRAAEERRFVEARISEQELSLRASEQRLSNFVEANRQTGPSTTTAFYRDRLQREVELQQQVLIGLAQSREEVRLREVRDTPVLTVIEPPQLPLGPDPSGRAQRLVAGFLAGTMLGVLAALLVGAARRERSDSPNAVRFRTLAAKRFRMFTLGTRRPN